MLFSIILKQLHLIEQIKYWYLIDGFLVVHSHAVVISPINPA